MLEILMFSVLGCAAVAGLISEAQKDDDEEDDNPPPEPSRDDQIELTFNPETYGRVDVSSGAGNDTITVSDSDLLLFGSIDAGGGDDTIVVPHFDGQIAGGEGNDQIESSGYGLNISGGGGDDTIIGAGEDGSVSSGDDGNDVLQIDFSAGLQEGAGVYGGDGDDTLSVVVRYDDSHLSDPPRLYGGDGEDLFEVALNDVNPFFAEPDVGPVDSGATVVQIEDFNPAEDALSILLPPGSAEAYNGARLESSGNDTLIVLLYEQIAEDDSLVETEVRINLQGVTGLDLSDVVIETATAA
ncbi:hypothetical protein [Xinfangfangia pollutisoli]|uniref:hypothetical protein n=1 Tax=Xinfangfangia pollutisoli TaxID=2865960 RepID=UPI001CD4A507|nr:hypothetical protein [Xinfangfangia pollutisoli]